MGKRTSRTPRSHTLPSSPTKSLSSSSSSSDFEFISLSPRKSSTAQCPADELFYKGQLLPLHLSPRLSMVRNLLSSSSTSSDSTATASRDSSSSSTDSHSSFTSDLLLLPHDCDSSRPSSAAEDDRNEFKRPQYNHAGNKKSTKYFSLSRISNVFRKDSKARSDPDNLPGSSSSVKRMSVTAKEVIRKYLKKVKPLYEKLSQKQQQKVATAMMMTSASRTISSANVSLFVESDGSAKDGGDLLVSVKNGRKDRDGGVSHSFSGNLRYPRRRSIVSSCPSSMRSSPSHSGLLNGSFNTGGSSSMEELQSAIQGAILHCKNSMVQNKGSDQPVSNEI